MRDPDYIAAQQRADHAERERDEARRTIGDLRTIANVNGDWNLKVAELRRERDEARAELATVRNDLALLVGGENNGSYSSLPDSRPLPGLRGDKLALEAESQPPGDARP